VELSRDPIILRVIPRDSLSARLSRDIIPLKSCLAGSGGASNGTAISDNLLPNDAAHKEQISLYRLYSRASLTLATPVTRNRY